MNLTLAQPNITSGITLVQIGEWVLLHVPTAEAKINATDKGDFVINNNDLFVMRLDCVRCRFSTLQKIGH